MEKFDVVVIGGGHAGVEAALASARLNKKTLMFMLMYILVCNYQYQSNLESECNTIDEE